MERSSVTQSLPSLPASNGFNSRYSATGSGFWQKSNAGNAPKQAAAPLAANPLSSSSSTPALPRIADALKHEGPRGSLWRESASVLQANASKLPFLNHSPNPHSDRSLVGTQELLQLQRDAKMTRDANASALRVAYETRGSIPRGLGTQLRAGGSLRPGDIANQAAATEAMGSTSGSFGSGAGGRRQKRQTKLSSHIRVVHRKENQQAALAKDQQYVQQTLARTVETPHTRQTREQLFDDHWWERIFAPIPQPLKFMPVAFQGISPLAAVRLTGQRWHVATPAANQPGQAAGVSLSYEEGGEILRVCTLFQALTEREDSSPPVLSRPAFCRMVCAMDGFSFSTGARMRLCRSLLHFDRLAEKVHVKGCSFPGGTVVGLLLQSNPGVSTGGFQSELAIIKMFTTLLKEMIPYGNGHDTETNWNLVKMRLFDQLFPQAERYAMERAALINRQIEGSGPSRPHIMQVEQKKLEVIAQPLDAASLPSGREGKGEGKGRDGRRRESAGGSISDNLSARGAPPSENLSARGSIHAPPPAAQQAAESGSDAEAETEDEAASGALLYAHTFAVLKGELLMSQLLEPEVLHILLEFKGLFHELFRAYADIPTIPESDGHMTLTAFLRFCDDFGLFPTKVDFQTAQWLYNTAESCQQASDESAEAETADASTEVPAQPEKGKGKGKRTRVNRNRLRDSVPHVGVGELLPVLWSGKWLKGHLAWLTKDTGEMSEAELRCGRLLETLNEWMSYRRLMSRDVFAMQVRENVTTITLEALEVAVDFMHLEDPPIREELAELLCFITSPTEKELDFATLDMALMITQKKREKLERATNSFLKDYKDMTQAEYSACLFFKELLYLLQRNKWTPEALFRKMDTDGNGALDPDEITRQAKSFLKMQAPAPSTVSAISVDSPFNILDLNGDNRITLEEFVQVFQQVEMAKEFHAHQKEEGQHPLFVSSNTASADTAMVRKSRNFGYKAFVECMVKVALVHLSYHGTAAQAEQSSLFKVLWLLMYLHWQFDRAQRKKEEVDAKKAAVEQKRSPKAEDHLPPLTPGPKHVTPLQRLLQDRPYLFSDMQMKPITSSLSKSNGFEKSAWGCVADDLLQECYTKSHQPQAHGPQSFDNLLFNMVTS